MSESWSYEDVLLPTVLWADGEEAWKYKTDSVVKLLKSKERLEMGDKNFGEIRGFFRLYFPFPLDALFLPYCGVKERGLVLHYFITDPHTGVL